MPCYHPLAGYRSRELNPTGKRNIVFNVNQGYRDMPVEVPCGQCIGCRLERSRQWAVRCMHEASLYANNTFITLTYADEHLPEHKSLVVSDFQKFMKRLRKEVFSQSYELDSVKTLLTNYEKRVRFFHCGEYGEKFGRPHYHACLFNLDFKDRYQFKLENGFPLYRSPTLEKLWTYGHSSIGTVTFESAAYVARYITKKVTGYAALHHYNDIHPETGEILSERRPEYTTMSRRPGIGKDWFDKYKSDVFPLDKVIMRNKKIKPPKYYDTQYELSYPSDFAKIKSRRIRAGKENKEDSTRDRLDVREEIHSEKFTRLKRKLDNEI